MNLRAKPLTFLLLVPTSNYLGADDDHTEIARTPDALLALQLGDDAT